jgi:arginyl-tRNA synthetase
MSTRAGEFVTLKDVVNEVGKDAARFIFLTRHYESPLDFDLDVAKQQTNDNPVYYVQYVHARISSILEKGRERGIENASWDEASMPLLDTAEDILLMKTLGRYPDVVKSSAALMEPHRITYYLMNLASVFHAYYSKHRVLAETAVLTNSRLYLVQAVQKVIRNGLNLLGVRAPEKM